MLELKNISRTYQPKKGIPVHALKNINLTFEDNGMVFVLGKSGSGKSTLLNLIGGLDFADSGEIVIDGKSTKDFKQSDYDSYRNTYIGFIFQEYNILNEFTVGENISLALELQSQKSNKERLEDILKEVELEGYADRKPNELSGGQKQRVAIARAIIKAPKIVMADEPTGALDSETGKAIFDTLKRLSKDRLVIVVSHDREFAETYGDRIIELADGEVINDERKSAQDSSIKDITNTQIGSKNIEIKKSRLPYKRALVMGAKTLRRKRFRLAITIILCFFSFVAFGFADVMVSFDIKNSVVKSLFEDDNYISVSASLPKYMGNRIYHNEIQSSLIDLDKIRQSTGLDFQGVTCNNYSMPLWNRELLNGENKLEYYVDSWGKAIVGTQQLFDEMGFKLYGRLPANQDEIVITRYCYDQFTLAGMKCYDSKNEEIIIKPNEIGDIQNFLDKKIRIRTMLTEDFHKPYTIVGIVDTLADADGKYAELVENVKPSQESYLYWAVNYYFTYGYHSLMYIHQSLYDEYVNERKNYTAEHPTGFGRNVSAGNSKVYGSRGIAPQESLKYVDEIIWLDGGGDRKQLAENEILVGIDAAFDLWTVSDSAYKVNSGYNRRFFNNLITFENMSLLDLRKNGKDAIAYCIEAEKISLDKLEIYKQYCKDINYIFDLSAINNGLDGYHDSSVKFVNWDKDYFYTGTNFDTLTENQWRCSYACYLSFTQTDSEGEYSGDLSMGGYNENVTGELCGREIAKRDGKRIFVENRIEKESHAMKQFDEENSKIKYSSATSEKAEAHTIEDFDNTPKIIGIYIPKEGYPADFWINDKVYYNSYAYEYADFDFLIAPYAKNKDKKAAIAIAEINYDQKNKRTFAAGRNPIFYAMMQTSAPIYIFYPWILGGSIVLGIFSVLLLGNYIAMSISSKKKEIGILRAVGAKKSDVFAIFINEGVIIVSMVLLLTVITIPFMCMGFNTILPSDYGVDMNIFNFGIRQIAVLLAVGFSTTAVATSLPLYKLSKKKPVDSIQDR